MQEIINRHHKITSKHFRRLLTCQKYFVWHELTASNHKSNDDYHDFEFDLPSFSDEVTHPLSEIQAKSLKIINEKFLAKMHAQFPNLKIISSGQLNNRQTQTMQALSQPDNTIYNPLFIYKYQNYDVVANPIVYDAPTQSVYFLKMSTNTCRRDIIKMFFDVNVMLKNQIAIKHVYLYIIATKKYRKGEVDFYATAYINNQKNGPTYKFKNEVHYYENAQMLKAGLSSENSWHIFNTITNKQVHQSFLFNDFDNYLQAIIYAQSYTSLMPLNIDDNQYLGDCETFWKTIVSEKNAHIYHNYNGKIITKNDIIKSKSLTDMAESRPLLKAIITNPQTIIVNQSKIFKIIKNIDDCFVVWFDFEAFSLPIAPLDNFLPFSHVVSQVSVIKTQKMREQSPINIVLDPQVISYDDFAKIIDVLYDQQADYYIVYNATYEHSRLNEFIQKMREVNYHNVQSYHQKVTEIISKTIDLANLFSTTSNQKIPPILITDLKGMYSIKKLEQYITTNYPDFFYKIKKYENLAIGNGLYAMQIANNRALNIIGDNEWKKRATELGEYCENDVRAMIMVYHFTKMIAHQQ